MVTGRLSRRCEWEVFKNSRFFEITIFLVLITTLFDETKLRDSLWAIYGAQGVVLLLLTLRLKDRWHFILSPSFITASYLLLNWAVGSYTYSIKLIYKSSGYLEYLDWIHLSHVVSLFLLANFLILLPYFLHAKADSPQKHKQLGSRGSGNVAELLLVSGFVILVLVLFSLVELDLSFAGASGNLTLIPKSLAALAAVIALARSRVRGRFVAYLLLLTFFATFSSHSKREAIFLALPILLIEAQRWSQPRIRPKWMISGVLLSLSLGTLVVMMSIYRGYGDFRPSSFFDSRNYIADYLSSPEAYEYLLNNFEINYIFYHSHQAVEYILDDPTLLLHGSTFAKVLFIPVPRKLYPNKPDGIVHHYTNYHSPKFRDDGGSWASTLLSEYFWNFHFVGLGFLFLSYWFLNSLFNSLIRNLREGPKYRHLLQLFTYQQLMEFIRGCGVDTLLVYVGLGALFHFTVFWPCLSLLRSISGSTNDSRSSRNRPASALQGRHSGTTNTLHS